jgi:hypothetical protein
MSVRVLAPVKALQRGAQPGGDDRRAAGAGGVRAGTSGAFPGLSGPERRALVFGWTAAAVIALVVCAFNVLTRVHDWPEQGVLLPLVLEGTSYPCVVLAMAFPAGVAIWLRRAQPGPWAAAQAHVAGAALFFTLHVGGFVLLRSLLFPLLFQTHYAAGSPTHDLPFELAKDVMAYAMSAGGTWVLLRWNLVAGAPAAPPRQVFDIRDGARLVRTPLEDILAVRSAGNYVEFVLGDGRRLLMRSPLAALEAELSGSGFVRTHRSWLVNAARMTGLRPEGSGDYAVELGGFEAPLSRRFPEALAALRG